MPCLLLRAAGSRPMVLAVGYAPHTLLALARALAEQSQTRFGRSLRVQTDVALVGLAREREPAAGPPLTLAELTDPPPQARAVLETSERGLTIRLAAPGMARGSKGLLGLAITGGTIMAVLSFLTSEALLHHGLRGDNWMLAGLLTAGWLATLGVLALAAVMGSRRAILDCVDGTLLITRQSMLGTRQRAWPAGEVVNVKVAPSGLAAFHVRPAMAGAEVIHQPMLNLQIVPRQGPVVGLLTERDDEELAWIARCLRIGLGL